MQEAWVGRGREVSSFEVVSTRSQTRAWPAIERRDVIGRSGLLDRIRGEFMEMPCVALSAPEAARLLGVSQPVCSRILESLIKEGSLRVTQDGRYTRPESAP